MKRYIAWLTLAAVSMISASMLAMLVSQAGGLIVSQGFMGTSKGAGMCFGREPEPGESAGEQLPEPALPDPENPFLRKMVKAAKDDLAERQSTEAAQIDLLEVKEVTWSDAGLGCPSPGMAYAQIPQDGLLIRLRIKKRTFSYHSGGTKAPSLCEKRFGEKPKTRELDKLVLPPDGLHQ